jgi:hypothetical protein
MASTLVLKRLDLGRDLKTVKDTWNGHPRTTIVPKKRRGVAAPKDGAAEKGTWN